MPKQTPSQTIGPFFRYVLTPQPYGRTAAVDENVVSANAAGERIEIVGRVFDGEASAVPDALIEVRQLEGLGRCATDEDGWFRFSTVKPGPVEAAEGPPQAPHVSLLVLARGMPSHAFTRMYFDDEEAVNAKDPVLSSVEESRRGTLIGATRTAPKHAKPGRVVYEFDIRLQGDNETVFFDA